ncbi:MAG: acyl-[acyl-carrier-protein] thioesterase [Candidatus Aminicenantaceae bacterium]
MIKIFKRRFPIQTYDIDFMGKLKLEAMLNFLQESAAEHALKSGLSFNDLLKKNLAWILSRYHIKIDNYPGLGDSIDISTWASKRSGIFTLREYEAFCNNKKVSAATTSWMAVDLDSKKPVRIEENLPDFPMHSRRVIHDDFNPLSDLKKPDFELKFPVLKGDLDLNRHVNNVVYIKWAIETVPQEVIFNLKPYRIEINYKNEVFYGDWIKSHTQKIKETRNDEYIHRLIRESDGKEVARLKSTWSKSEP